MTFFFHFTLVHSFDISISQSHILENKHSNSFVVCVQWMKFMQSPCICWKKIILIPACWIISLSCWNGTFALHDTLMVKSVAKHLLIPSKVLGNGYDKNMVQAVLYCEAPMKSSVTMSVECYISTQEEKSNMKFVKTYKNCWVCLE